MHGSDGTDDLERLSREQLILKARVLGVERPELMTRVEMRDEIVRRSEPDPVQQKRARGFLGVARDLVASVVEAGLNLPDAAAIIRGEGAREGDWKGPPPVATVTLAEIYAAQGHLDRALRMLDEVLAKEPDHDAARSLRDRLAAGADVPKQPAPRRQRISFADPPESDLPAEPLTHSERAPAPEPEPEPAPAPAPAPEPVPESAPAPAAAPPPASPYVLTLAVAGQRQVYWEVPAHTWDALRSRAPHGRAVLRVLSFRTRAGKVERRAHDLSPDAEVGSAVLPGLNADAVVRAALGWESDGRFLPFVIASDLVPGRFRAHPLVGPVAAEVERRAAAHLSRGAVR
ncbi:MAG TPA: tetratricopeptide repeat protein [Polyangiaceae bacterium]